jgi:hypothetical protein
MAMENLESWRKGFIKSSRGKGDLGQAIIGSKHSKKILKSIHFPANKNMKKQSEYVPRPV